MATYPIPAFVLENAEKRLAVALRSRHRTCAIDHCGQPATHSPVTSYDACETHRIHPPNPTSDPARRLYALRDRAIAQRAHTAEEQLRTVHIRYTWASEAASQETAA